MQTVERLWSGSGYLSDVALGPDRNLGPAGHRHSATSSGRACCQWGHHPRTVVLSTGKHLLSVDVRAQGGGSELRLWACALGEGLLSLSSSSPQLQVQCRFSLLRCCNPSALSCAVPLLCARSQGGQHVMPGLAQLYPSGGAADDWHSPLAAAAITGWLPGVCSRLTDLPRLP